MSDVVLTHNQMFATPQDALAHFGVKGMKWGVRNEKASSGPNLKRVSKYEANAARAQAMIDKVEANPSKYAYGRRQQRQHVEELTKHRDKQQKAADDIRGGRHLTDTQRKIVIGAAVAGAVLAAYGGYKYVDSGAFQQTKVNLLEKRSGEKFSWKKLESLTHLKGEDDIFNGAVKQINPGYGDRGTKMNCRRCTFAYEMRRRGYDVNATKSISATGQTATGVVNAMTPGSKLPTGRLGIMSRLIKEGPEGSLNTVIQNPWGVDKIGDDHSFSLHSASEKSSMIFRSLSQHPEGARGELGVGWTFGGGHSMAWEIIGGKPVIFDGQSGDKYGTAAAFEKFAANVTAAGHTRLDNVTLNDEFLKRWVQNAG